MTIEELLESQNLASVCKRENTFTDVTTTSGTVQQLTSFQEVCYDPIKSHIHFYSLIIIFFVIVIYIKKFSSK